MVFPRDDFRVGFVAVVVCGVALSWSGCAEMGLPLPGGPVVGDPGVDAGPMVDAAPPDAIPIDAPPPWDPPDPVLPDEPCEIVSDLPEVAYDADMANYAIRFRDGQGLEASGDIRQSGLLEVENADVDKRDAVEKRLGADVLGDTRSATPGDVVPDASRRAIWTRGNEVVLQTESAIYSKNTATTASQWRRVGAWTKTQLREAIANTFGVVVVNADMARLGDAMLVVYELFASGGTFAVYGPGMTREVSQALATAERPRLTHEGDRVRLTYRDTGANALFTDTWLPGDAAVTPANSTISVVAGRAWDVHSEQMQDTATRVTAFIRNGTAVDDVNIRLGVAGTLTNTFTRNTPGAIITDVGVSVWPRQIAIGPPSDIFRVAYVAATRVGGVERISVRFVDLNATTGATAADIGVDANLADTTSPVISVTLGWVDRENIAIGVEQNDPGGGTPFRKVTYYTLARGGAIVGPVAIHNFTALTGQAAIVAGTPVDTLVSAGAEPLVPVFKEQLLPGVGGGSDVTKRSGWVLFAPVTGEIVARSFTGYTGDVTDRAGQPPKGSVIAQGGLLTWAWPASPISDPLDDTMATAVCTLDLRQYPAEPAMANDAAVDAMAGYPRAYDGTNVFEHDWHTLPFITTVSNLGAGATTAGDHFLAVTWEDDDANGYRYTSAPYFRPLALTSSGVGLTVTIEPLSHTERVGPRIVVWMTVVGGGAFFRAAEAPATGAVQTITVSITDANLVLREQLDQGLAPSTLGVATSDRARVTDFVSRAGDRLHSRDPLRGSLVRYTIPSRTANGDAVHWPLSFAVDEPDEREATAVADMDGRVIVGSALGLAMLTGDGPDATGSGSFGLPVPMRTEQGIRDQAVLARTPIGYAFGTRGGEPKLLTPGLTVEDVAKQVERVYKIEGGNIVSIAYDQNREEMLFLANAGRTLRLNTSTGRWASDPNRLGRDLTVTKDGTLYLIRSDGKVLKQREDVWADGGVGYALKVSTPWIRDMARDATTHSSFRLGAVYVSGEYLGPHALFFDIYKDFNDVTPWATYQVPQADVVGNNTANRGWIYGVRIGGRDSFLAARIAVRDGAEPNRTFRLAQMDVEILTDKSSQYAELPQTHYARV